MERNQFYSVANANYFDNIKSSMYFVQHTLLVGFNKLHIKIQNEEEKYIKKMDSVCICLWCISGIIIKCEYKYAVKND